MPAHSRAWEKSIHPLLKRFALGHSSRGLEHSTTLARYTVRRSMRRRPRRAHTSAPRTGADRLRHCLLAADGESCSRMMSASATRPRPFEFDRDTFAYANELVWDYVDGGDPQKLVPQRSQTPRTYTHRCFVMVRSARQFFHHARFDASLPPLDDPGYGRLVRAVVARNPRRGCAEAERIVVPGYDSLRSFSQARAAVLMAHCGGMWQSYVLRSHWRMILPVSRRHQEKMAAQLAQSLAARGAVIVHLFRFPQLTINHGILLYDQIATGTGLKFTAYDPNCPTQPTELTYRTADRTFYFPRNHYWAGGQLSVMETYCGWFY